MSKEYVRLHQDPNLRGHWKTDSAGRYLQWMPHPTEPKAKADLFWKRVRIELTYLFLILVGAATVFYCLMWATEGR